MRKALYPERCAEKKLREGSTTVQNLLFREEKGRRLSYQHESLKKYSIIY